MQGLSCLHDCSDRQAASPFAVLNTLQHDCGMQCRPAIDVYRQRLLHRHAHSAPGRTRRRQIVQALDKALCLRRASTICRAQAVAVDPTITGQPQQEAAPSSGAKQQLAQSSAYPFEQLEAKWQNYWAKHKTFRTPGINELDKSKPKFYALDMFPYPRSVCYMLRTGQVPPSQQSCKSDIRHVCGMQWVWLACWSPGGLHSHRHHGSL